MDTAEAYRLLQLQPLDEFLNRHEGTSGIGATTWMLVEAVLHAHKEPVIICARTVKEAQKLSQEAWDLGKKLGRTDLPLHFSSYNTVNNRLHVGRQFWDAKWKDMAIRRRMGPYERVARLVHNPSKGWFDAQDERGEFILGLTYEGANQMVEDRPFIDLEDPENVLGWG